jgi:predicted lysophospholipase L1 biosynthesis ABC-type transport system permease subunit
VSALAGLRATARIAWRDTIRHLGRSLLIAILLTLPAAELASATVLFRYGDLRANMTLGGANIFPLLWLSTLAAAALTAAAALGVGVRRQLRELGLLAANGAARWQLSAVVLFQGAGLGLLGGVAGIGAGLGLTWVAFPIMRTWLNPVTDERGTVLVPEFSVVGRDLLWILVFVVTVALLTALRPVWLAARLPVSAALAGRLQQYRPRPRPWLAVLGVAIAAAGIGVQLLASYLEFQGVLPPGPLQLLLGGTFHNIPAGLVYALVGTALCGPSLVAFAGRHPPRRPAVLRLAVRDAARHLGRSGPAVAAITVGLGMLVALASLVPDRSTFNSVEYMAQPLLWSPPLPLSLRLLLVLVTAFTLLVVLALNALGRAEARDDLATLGALGAAPGTLRGLAAASAWLLTQTGALLGAGTALALIVAMRTAAAQYLPVWPVRPPWTMLALVVVAVPAVAALAGALSAGRRPAPTEPRQPGRRTGVAALLWSR